MFTNLVPYHHAQQRLDLTKSRNGVLSHSRLSLGHHQVDVTIVVYIKGVPPTCYISSSTLHYNTTYKMPLAVTSATGKLGGGVLNAILENKLIDPKDLVICVSPTCTRFGFNALIFTARHPQIRKASVSMPSDPWV